MQRRKQRYNNEKREAKMKRGGASGHMHTWRASFRFFSPLDQISTVLNEIKNNRDETNNTWQGIIVHFYGQISLKENTHL